MVERDKKVERGIQMGVEVDDRDGTVFAVDGAEEGECDGMVTSQSDQTRQCLAHLRRARLVGMCVWSAAQEQVVALLDLLERIGVVVPANTSAPILKIPETVRWFTYEVTGMSPQSITLAQELNGFAASGTL
jgi:hypothetical protein